MSSRTALNDLFPEWQMNDREVVWLWLVLKERGMDLKVEEFGVNRMHDRMAWYIKDKDGLSERLHESKAKGMLPGHDLVRMEKDNRQVNWLLSEIEKLFRGIKSSMPECPAHLKPKDKLIALLDYWRESITEKKRFLEHWLQAWNRHIDDDKFFDWFKQGNEKQKAEIAWNWYRQNYRGLTRYTPKFNDLEDIFFLLDTSNFKLNEKRFHITEIRKAFNVAKTKKNQEGKKQTNLLLGDDVRNLLDNLAKNQRLTMTAVVERLIRHASVHGIPKESLSEPDSKN